MLRGSCLCGGVRYEITGPLSGALNCHCSMCRKAQGAAFRSRTHSSAAAKRRAVRFSTHRAVTIERAGQWTGDFVAHATT